MPRREGLRSRTPSSAGSLGGGLSYASRGGLLGPIESASRGDGIDVAAPGHTRGGTTGGVRLRTTPPRRWSRHIESSGEVAILDWDGPRNMTRTLFYVTNPNYSPRTRAPSTWKGQAGEVGEGEGPAHGQRPPGRLG